MNNDDLNELIRKFNSGEISEAEIKKLEKWLEEGRIEIKDFQVLAELDKKISGLQIPDPGEKLDHAFYAMLAHEKRLGTGSWAGMFSSLFQKSPWWPVAIRTGYAAFLILMGFVAGFALNSIGNRKIIRELSEEVKQMNRVMMISLIEQPSATDRLKAVSIANRLNEADHQVIEAQLHTLNQDENVNVRLAAIDALLKYSKYESVRKGLVESIVLQKSPLVQVTLAEAMARLQEKSAIQNLEILLKDERVIDPVKEKIRESIKKIS